MGTWDQAPTTADYANQTAQDAKNEIRGLEQRVADLERKFNLLLQKLGVITLEPTKKRFR